MRGHIPTAWYPYRVAVSPDGRHLATICFKGFGNGPNGGATAAAVAGNAIDIGYSDMVSIASAVGRNVPFVVIAPAGMSEATAPVNLLMVAANSLGSKPTAAT